MTDANSHQVGLEKSKSEEKKGDCRILQITMTDMKLGNGGVSRVVVLKESFQNEAGKMYWAKLEPP